MGFQLGAIDKVEYATDGDTATPTWNTLGTDYSFDTWPAEEQDTVDLGDGQSVTSFYRVPFDFNVHDVDNSNIGSIDEHTRTWFRFTDLEGNQLEVPATGSGKRGLYPKKEDQGIVGPGEQAAIKVRGESTGVTKGDAYSLTRV